MCDSMYEGLQVLEPEERPMDRMRRLAAINGPLLAWYGGHARILPWRDEPTPYRVWISEIMLQQTRVEAVKPYFRRFMEALPSVEALACVEEERLLKLWEGLGYYQRARNLKRAAQIMVSDYGGRVPDEYKQLLSLPGIGSYTAGAIASIAYGRPVPAVDGNVLRVLSRLLASREDILRQPVKRRFESELSRTMDHDRAGSFNQGLMELGAVVCLPNGEPRCDRCPLASLCLTRKQGIWEEIPFHSPKKPRRIEERTVLLIRSGDQIAIRKRPDHGLLASLYEFPSLEGRQTAGQVRALFQDEDKGCRIEPAGDAVHVFSHVEWHMTGYLVFLKQIPAEYMAVECREIFSKYPLPNAFRAYIKRINGES